MDNTGYVALTKQMGLLRELNTVANNIANMNTSGFRREGAVFAEHIAALRGEEPSLSMSTLSRRYVDTSVGETQITNAPLDVAIDGEGFFLVETPNGERLTRDGAFSISAEGELTTSQGFRVLDESGGAIAIPQTAEQITIAEDGAIFADGQPVSAIGVVTTDNAGLVREGANVFEAQNGYLPVESPRVRQGAIEGSNVNAIEEMARLIEVQRAYQASKDFSNDDNERIERTIRTLGRSQ